MGRYIASKYDGANISLKSPTHTPVKRTHRKFVGLPLLSKEIETCTQKIVEINNYEDIEQEGQLIWNLFYTFIKENNVLPAEMVDKP